MKKIALVVIGVSLIITACNKSGGVSGYEKTQDGVLYKLFASTSSAKAKMGDVLTVNLVERTQSDSIVQAHQSQLIVRQGEFKGDPRASLTMVGVGDSISFMVPIDSLIRVNNPTPEVQAQIAKVVAPFKKHGNFIRLDIKVIGLQSADQIKSAQQAAATEAASKAQSALSDYLSDNKIKAKQTPSGLYYVIDKKGNGPLPKAGQNVTVNYTGKLLDGTVFDSSLKPGRQPFSFPLGQGQVIKGWDEGIALFPVGSKGRLFIPSDLAYGPQGNGGIPPNSPLVFDIEVISVK